MVRKTKLIGIGAALGMLILILDSKTALNGAMNGIDICIRTVIPSLFPFFVLSAMLTGSVRSAAPKFFAPIGRLCGIPKGAESIFLTGLIGGYPIGARSIAYACRSGQLAKADGKRMLAFCSNAGPAFIFGMAGTLFQDAWIPWSLWIIQIAGAVFTSAVLPRGNREPTAIRIGTPLTLTSAVQTSVASMANVCAWVVLFRVLIGFLERWVLWLLPAYGQVLAAGLLELSNGCLSLDRIANTGLRFILCSAILAFGGLCVAMQTVSAAEQVDTRLYLPGKMVQTTACVSISCLLQWIIPGFERADHLIDIQILSLIFLFFAVWILRKMQKSSSIPVPLGV